VRSAEPAEPLTIGQRIIQENLKARASGHIAAADRNGPAGRGGRGGRGGRRGGKGNDRGGGGGGGGGDRDGGGGGSGGGGSKTITLEELEKKKRGGGSRPARTSRAAEEPRDRDYRLDAAPAPAKATTPKVDLVAEVAARQAAVAAAKKFESDQIARVEAEKKANVIAERAARVTPELYALIAPMSDAHKKTPPAARLEALEKLGGIIARVGFPEVEAMIVSEFLPIVLMRHDDKPKVRELAAEIGRSLVAKLSVQGFLYAMPFFFSQLRVEAKGPAKVGSMILLDQYMERVFKDDRDLLSACLPELVPALSALLHDTRSEVCDQAEKSLLVAMRGITNTDLEPFVDSLVLACKDRDQTEETIQKLGGIVFVQTVEGSALAVVVPLLLAGFRQPKAMVKRMCARIVSNMSKLVADPLEAAVTHPLCQFPLEPYPMLALGRLPHLLQRGTPYMYCLSACHHHCPALQRTSYC
jgi:hypothetical protein